MRERERESERSRTSVGGGKERARQCRVATALFRFPRGSLVVVAPDYPPTFRSFVDTLSAVSLLVHDNDGGDAAVILHATCCPLAARPVTLIRSRAEQRRAGGRPNLAPDLGNAPAHRRSELTAVWTGKLTFWIYDPISRFLAERRKRGRENDRERVGRGYRGKGNGGDKVK